MNWNSLEVDPPFGSIILIFVDQWGTDLHQSRALGVHSCRSGSLRYECSDGGLEPGIYCLLRASAALLAMPGLCRQPSGDTLDRQKSTASSRATAPMRINVELRAECEHRSPSIVLASRVKQQATSIGRRASSLELSVEHERRASE